MADRDEAQLCSKDGCSGKLDRQVTTFSPKIWKPITLEHVDVVPRTFNTEQSLKDYCKTNNLSSGALL